MKTACRFALSIVAAFALAMVCLPFTSAFAQEASSTTGIDAEAGGNAPSSLSAFAQEGRATFDTGSNVRSAWTALAGSRDNVTSILQFFGDAVPEGVQTRIVSSADSSLPIYSWFEDGIIYYWSEDPRPLTNADASYMFNGFAKATYIDAAPFDTSQTTDMEAMFANCTSLETLDVSGFDTSNARCMYCMFIYDSSLKELDVSHFNTSRVTQTSDENYGSLCGMFIGCAGLTKLDLSSFDMRSSIGWPYNVQNMFPGCTSLGVLVLGPNVRFNSYTALSGSWTHEGDGLTLSGAELCRQYNASNAFAYSGTWIRNMPEGHYYRTDGSLGENNLWEVHTPADRFKGYCLNLNRFGVGEELDRVLAEDDDEIIDLLCTEEQGSTHGSAPLGSTMREALITLIYYGWPNDAAGIQQRYGLSDQEYMEVTQNAVWDFTDRYENPAGPTHYEGNLLNAYNELVAQRYANIEGSYVLFLYKSWDPSKQNLLSIMGVDDQEYGGVEVRKQDATGSENLAGAEFTVYDESGEAVGAMTSSANGTAFICRTDHTEGLPLGKYTVRETKAPQGYKISDVEYHFEITEANEIVSIGWRMTPEGDKIEEEMIFFDDHDDEYVGGGVGILKQSDTGKMLVGAEFTIFDDQGAEVTKLVTNDSGVAATGKQDLPLGIYTVKETRAPEGYTISEDTQQVQITENFQFLMLTFTDNEKHGSITLQATKQFEGEGAQLEAGMFTFQLLDAKGQLIQTATNDADGNVTFKTIEYAPSDLGYKNYSIVEVIGDDPTIGYDRHAEDVTVTIYDTGADTLSCEAVYDSDGAVFVNTNDVKHFDVSILKKRLNSGETIEGAVLEIRDGGNRVVGSWTSSGEAYVITLEPGTYTLRELSAPAGYYEVSTVKFTVAADGTLASGSPYAAIDGSSMNVFDKPINSTELEIKKVDSESKESLEGAKFTLKSSDSGYAATVVTDSDGAACFEGLETGSYELTEAEPPEGYKAGAGPWTVEVECERAISKTPNVNANGVASGEYPGNLFNRDTIRIGGSPESIHVALRYQTEDGYDYLRLRDKDGNYITQDMDGNPIGDTRSGYAGYIWGGLNDGVINTLSFDLEMDEVTFEFKSDENLGGYGYYAVVSSEPVITVTDSEGNKVDPEEGVYAFENDKRKAAEVEFSGTKTLEGKDLTKDEFSFRLTGPDGFEETVANNADGTFAFSKITFDKEGTYEYQVVEVAGNEAGVTYDDKAYALTVTVKADEAGDLVAEVSGGSKTGDDITFTNTYKKSSSTSVQFGGVKTLEGKDLTKGEFSFALSGPGALSGTALPAAVANGSGAGKDANTMASASVVGELDSSKTLIAAEVPTSEEATVQNDADGTYAFPEITFTEEGTYEYEVREVKGSEAGVTYDDRVYSVKVVVKKNDEGDLVATIEGDSETGKDFNFANTYKETSSTSVTFSGVKVLEGKDLTKGEFEFSLTGSDGVDEKVANSADGTFAFPEIKFDKAGTYTYKVSEVAGKEAGVTYDTNAYDLTVTVTEEESGKLVAKISGDSTTGKDLEFVNSFASTDKVSVLFAGKKTLEGRTLKKDEFSFELVGDGDVKETVKNAADGTFSFSELAYDKEGVYSYKVHEIAGDDADITYDKKEYEITVTVSKDESGKLTTAISGDSKTGKDLEFKNTYAKKATKEMTSSTTKSTLAKTGDGLSFAETMLGGLAFSAALAIALSVLRKRKQG